MDSRTIGTRLLQEGRPVDALAAFEEELTTSPTSVSAALGKGCALLELARLSTISVAEGVAASS